MLVTRAAAAAGPRGTSASSSSGGGAPHRNATPAPVRARRARSSSTCRRGTAAIASSAEPTGTAAAGHITAALKPAAAAAAAAPHQGARLRGAPIVPHEAPATPPSHVCSHALQDDSLLTSSSSCSSNAPSDTESPPSGNPSSNPGASAAAPRLVRAFKTPRGRVVHMSASAGAPAAPRQHSVRVPTNAARGAHDSLDDPTASSGQHQAQRSHQASAPQPRRRHSTAAAAAAAAGASPRKASTSPHAPSAGASAAPGGHRASTRPASSSPAPSPAPGTGKGKQQQQQSRGRRSWGQVGRDAAVLLAAVVLLPLLAQQCAVVLRVGSRLQPSRQPALQLASSPSPPWALHPHGLQDLKAVAWGALHWPSAAATAQEPTHRAAAAPPPPHHALPGVAAAPHTSVAQHVSRLWGIAAPAWGWIRAGGGSGFAPGARDTRTRSTSEGGSGGGGGSGGAGRIASFPPTGGLTRQWGAQAAVRMLGMVPAGVASPYRDAPWDEVFAHVGRRLAWNDPSFQLLVFSEQELLASPETWKEFMSLIEQKCQVLLGGALTSPVLASKLKAAAAKGWLPALRIFLPATPPPTAASAGAREGASGGVPQQQTPAELLALTSLNGHTPQSMSALDQALAKLMPWGGVAKAAEVWPTLLDLWSRHTSDDLLFVLLVLINTYLTNVPQVSMTTKGFDLPSLQCMLTHCRSEVVSCVRNPTCKAALNCLQSCSFNDQTCAYRCIVSYETPALTAFSLCILEKNNCRSLSMDLPALPNPAPMATFRGAPLSHDTAEGMLLGWLDTEAAPLVPTQGGASSSGLQPFSWLVAAGKNPAYDYFPCQHQLFYRGKAKGTLWYAPVFKVKTVDGREVWRERRYRVRRGQVPGTFHLSVLDNGVTSKEFWRVLDCSEDLEWVLLYYGGAASTAGLQYSGAVLGTRDGSMPTSPSTLQRLEAALDLAGIKPWELSLVNNKECAGAPLAGLVRA